MSAELREKRPLLQRVMLQLEFDLYRNEQRIHTSAQGHHTHALAGDKQNLTI